MALIAFPRLYVVVFVAGATCDREALKATQADAHAIPEEVGACELGRRGSLGGLFARLRRRQGGVMGVLSQGG